MNKVLVVGLTLVLVAVAAQVVAAQERAASAVKDSPSAVATPAPAVATPVVAAPAPAVAAPVVSADKELVVVGQASAGLNSFLVMDTEKMIVYTCNMFGNAGVRWEVQDLQALTDSVEQARAKNQAKKK